MKFDVIIGNPPYQLSDGGAQASAKPIYQYFVEQAKNLKPSYLTMIIPARWYAGGKGLDGFRDTMLSDIHIKELHDFPNTGDCFPGVNIRGGVCYFLWDNLYDNQKTPVRVITYTNNGIIESFRKLKIEGSDVFIRYSTAINIFRKVTRKKEISISKYISPRKPFSIDGSLINTEEFHNDRNGMREPVKCYGKAGTVGYIEKSIVGSHTEWIDKWKVYMPYANNIGTELNDDNQNTFIGEPDSVCTETFIIVGGDLNLDKNSAINLSNYMRTRFARFLLSLSKSSQHATSKAYTFVPIQDFSKPWTDRELYDKYDLTKEERDFIESMIKPMNTKEDETAVMKGSDLFDEYDEDE